MHVETVFAASAGTAHMCHAGGAEQGKGQMWSSLQAHTSRSLHAGADDTQGVQAGAGGDARCWLGWGAALALGSCTAQSWSAGSDLCCRVWDKCKQEGLAHLGRL